MYHRAVFWVDVSWIYETFGTFNDLQQHVRVGATLAVVPHLDFPAALRQWATARVAPTRWVHYYSLYSSSIHQASGFSSI